MTSLLNYIKIKNMQENYYILHLKISYYVHDSVFRLLGNFCISNIFLFLANAVGVLIIVIVIIVVIVVLVLRPGPKLYCTGT